MKKKPIITDNNKTDYPFYKAQEVATRFESIFSVPFQNFMNKELALMMLFGHITIDVIKFDKYLQRIHAKDYVDGVSMQRLILNKYGYKGWRLIKDLLT